MSELAPVVDGLQVEQEASYRYVAFRYRSLALERIARRQGQGDIKVLGPVTWLDSYFRTNMLIINLHRKSRDGS